MNQQDELFSINFNNKPLRVSTRLAAHHQENQLCINSNMRYVDYTNCCLYRVDPPDLEQQACSKHYRLAIEIN
jgi:hypothetical protein